MHQRRHLATLTVSATVSAIAHQVGRLVLISSLIGSGFSLYPLLPGMAQTTTAQAVDEAEEDADPASAAESSASESADDATTESSESSESSDSAPATDRRSPLSTARPNLRVGNEGQAVVELQALLKLLGYYEGAVDGRYSEETASAVSEFQAAAGLASDGVVGPATWGQLLPAVPVASPTSSADQTPSAAAVTVTDFPTPVLSPGELASGTATTATETDDATAVPPADSTAAPGATSTSTPTTADDASATAEPPAAVAAADAATETEPTATASLPADGSNPTNYPILRIGASGPAVERLQERLRSLGHYQGAVDGVFGERTQEAVRAAQQRNQLTVDGVVGPATWDALLD